MSQRILLIEDNQTDIELTRRVFSKIAGSCSLEVKDDGQDALNYLMASDSHLPQLILLDLKMSRIGGLEVLAAIRKNERTRRIPVVMLTSSAEERDIVSAYELGANSYICKPVDFSVFSETMQYLVKYWFEINHSPIAG